MDISSSAYEQARLAILTWVTARLGGGKSEFQTSNYSSDWALQI